MPKIIPQTTKRTFSLDRVLVRQLKKLASQGAITSQSGFVEQAVAKELKRLARHRLEQEFMQAGDDPMLRADIVDIEQDFAVADHELMPEK